MTREDLPSKSKSTLIRYATNSNQNKCHKLLVGTADTIYMIIDKILAHTKYT